MTSPAIALPFVRIRIDHPPSPAIGQPCRIGSAVGIRTYDPLYEEIQLHKERGESINTPFDAVTLAQLYTRGEVPVSFQHTTWRIRVHNPASTTAGPGEIVHYLDGLTDNVPTAETNCAVRPADPAPDSDAIVGLLLEQVEPNATKDVHVLLQYARRDWHWLSCPAVQRLPNVRNGEWVFRSTRVPIALLFEHLQDGGNINDFLEDHDTVSQEQAVEVLQHTVRDLWKYADPTQTSPYPTAEAAPKT